MEKLFDKNCITIDGKMDEPVWSQVEAHSDFRQTQAKGGKPSPEKTYFKVIPCEDRVYFGIYCWEKNMERARRIAANAFMWVADVVEVIVSPMGSPFEFYHFAVSLHGQSAVYYYSEAGNIQPDPYAPDWNYAIDVADDHWSAEFELPLTAFYMTKQDSWSTDWLLNVCRTCTHEYDGAGLRFSCWCDVVNNYIESDKFRPISGMPMRPAADDVRISSAAAQLNKKYPDGFRGMLTVQAETSVGGEFILSAGTCADAAFTLQPGINNLSVPCSFAEEGREQVTLQLKRVSDGKVFKRGYPVRVAYEPIRLQFTLPEFRTNFYPGQDASRIVGKVMADEPCTLTLEGPGIPAVTVTPDEAGNFAFDTPNFEIGDALLTVRTASNTLTKKIRRLAPSERTMTWISGGNLIINGKPTLRRNMYANGYHGGKAFDVRYKADNLHETPGMGAVTLEPARLIPGADSPNGEATKDAMPSAAMFAKIQERMDEGSTGNFAYYYISDEPECRNISSVYLKHIYDYVTERDPYHVVLSASRASGDYINCVDWVEPHPYIDPQVRDGKRYYGRDIHAVADPIEAITSLGRSDKCVGFLPTCFSYKMNSAIADYPTFDEMICHIWSALLAGAKTLWPYAYHDLGDRASLYEGTRYTHSSAEVLEELLLLGKRTELYRTQAARSVLWELDNEKMFALANFTNEPQTITLDGISGTWHNFRHAGMITGNTFTLEPLEVLVGTSEVKDAGLPTYAETKAIVDKAEYERTQTASLFFGKEADIKVTGTGMNYRYKLFDGVRDVYAWGTFRAEGETFDVTLGNAKTAFTKLVVSGYQIDNMELKFEMGGELVPAPVAESKTEEFTNTYLFAEPVSPDGLQFVFHRDCVELYEIEAF